MQLKIRTVVSLFLSLLVAACVQTGEEVEYSETYPIGEAYDIFLIMGQSNTHAGLGLDPALDGAIASVRQLGRLGGYDLKVIDGAEPLHHASRTPGRIGFALAFARRYAVTYTDTTRKVLLLPCAVGGTGFVTGHWHPGQPLYEDALQRLRYVLAASPESELKAILWHQGESDVGSATYAADLDHFIDQFREDAEHPNLPFILGGMVPWWVAQEEARQVHQDILRRTPDRVAGTAYVDPEQPFIIAKPDNTFDAIHYDADGMRELGKRYFEAYSAFFRKAGGK